MRASGGSTRQLLLAGGRRDPDCGPIGIVQRPRNLGPRHQKVVKKFKRERAATARLWNKGTCKSERRFPDFAFLSISASSDSKPTSVTSDRRKGQTDAWEPGPGSSYSAAHTLGSSPVFRPDFGGQVPGGFQGNYQIWWLKRWRRPTKPNRYRGPGTRGVTRMRVLTAIDAITGVCRVLANSMGNCARPSWRSVAPRGVARRVHSVGSASAQSGQREEGAPKRMDRHNGGEVYQSATWAPLPGSAVLRHPAHPCRLPQIPDRPKFWGTARAVARTVCALRRGTIWFSGTPESRMHLDSFLVVWSPRLRPAPYPLPSEGAAS